MKTCKVLEYILLAVAQEGARDKGTKVSWLTDIQ